jgi:signal transduction histidine kinase
VEGEREVARLYERVEELERYAAVVAHELLTPLVMIDAYASTLAERLDDGRHPDEQRDLLAVRRAAARTRVLAETLLYHARGDGRALQARELDLDPVLSECLIVLAPEIHARRAEVEVGALPVVRGEEPLIGAVFTNLIGNALKYGPRVGATIRVAAEREPTAWRFVIHSQGRTIPPEERERIFAPFERGRGERRVEGGGLGLAICRQIVERHGGRIGVADVDGETVFEFTLPAS